MLNSVLRHFGYYQEPRPSTEFLAFKETFESTKAAGLSAGDYIDAKTDGNDDPLRGTPNADKVSVKRVDTNTIETTLKKDGKTVMKTHAMVSSDGKTRTVTFDGTDPQGNKVHNVIVIEKGM